MFRLSSRAVTKNGDELVFFSEYYNLLYSYNLNNEKIDILCHIEGEPFIKKELFSCILKWNNDFVLVPYNAKYVYHLKNDFSECRSVGIMFKGEAKFATAAIVGDDIYLINHNYKSIIKMNLLTGESYEISVPEGAFFYSSYCYGSCIYLPMCNCNGVCVLNVVEDKLETFLFSGGCGFNAITKTNDGFCLGPRNGNELIFISEKCEFLKRVEIKEWNSYGMFRFDNQLLIPSNIYKGIYNGTSNKLLENGKVYCTASNGEEGIYILVDDQSNLELFDLEQNQRREVKLEIDDESVYDYIKGNEIIKNTSNFNIIFEELTDESLKMLLTMF